MQDTSQFELTTEAAAQLAAIRGQGKVWVCEAFFLAVHELSLGASWHAAAAGSGTGGERAGAVAEGNTHNGGSRGFSISWRCEQQS